MVSHMICIFLEFLEIQFFKNRFSAEFEQIAAYWSPELRNAKIKEISSNKITDINATRPLLAIEEIEPKDESCLAIEPNYQNKKCRKLKFNEAPEVKEVQPLKRIKYSDDEKAAKSDSSHLKSCLRK